MSERIITFRLNSETAKLYDEYREKWIPAEVSDSQIIRAGLEFLMIMPEAGSNNEIEKLTEENDQIIAEMREIIKKNPDPKLYELWVTLMANVEKISTIFVKTAEKYSNIVGEGKKGRKPDPTKKHTPGRPSESEKGYNS
jgi:hypothetical protein